ncbi:hypothetical protein RCO48_08355 [Peribacillus frigoritolerans]|nr:hypothetical protein [Peribacillus frigoritolerans]
MSVPPLSVRKANHNSSFLSYDGSDFFSILEYAIREADRKWREDELEQKNKKQEEKTKGNGTLVLGLFDGCRTHSSVLVEGLLS